MDVHNIRGFMAAINNVEFEKLRFYNAICLKITSKHNLFMDDYITYIFFCFFDVLR